MSVHPLTVAFAAPTHDRGADAAWAWLERAPGLAARRVAWAEAHTAQADVLWLHSTRTAPEPPEHAALARRVASGGVLLTGAAAALPARIGMEPVPPDTAGHDTGARDPTTSAPGHRGHASYRGHPIFDGLGNAAYTWAAVAGEQQPGTAYTAPGWPMHGRVVAVERGPDTLRAGRATIWEYAPAGANWPESPWTRPDGENRLDTGGDPTPGSDAAPADPAATAHPAPRTVCIGAYVDFGSRDPLFRPHLGRLVSNALRHAAGRHAGASASHWRLAASSTREDPTLRFAEPPILAGTLPIVRGAPWTLAGPVHGDAPFSHAGLRAVATGGQIHGVSEVWIHPLRVLHRLEADGVRAAAFTATPVGLERRLERDGATIHERVVVPLALPAFLVEWELDPGTAASVELDITWRIDLRLARPYPTGVQGPLDWRCQDRALVVATEERRDAALFAWSEAPQRWRVDDASATDAPALAVHARVRLEPGRPVRLAVVGSATGTDALDAATAALRRVDGAVHARAAAVRRAQRERLAVRAPDPDVAAAVEWARYHMASDLAETPGLGRCFVTGYGQDPVAPGVDGPNDLAYSGPDAVWTALAALAAGDFEGVREVVRFLGAHQDLDGKILHTCTTSGVARYDAADATPLYLLLVARYLAWSGDTGLVRHEWDRILAAYRFCLRTDADRDGLVESTRRDHGAAGGLGVHTAAVWAAALTGLGDAAEAIGEPGFADEARKRAERARAAFEAAFFDPEHRVYALELRRPEGAALSPAAMDSSRSTTDLVPGGGPAAPSGAPRARLPVVGAATRNPWTANLAQTPVQAVAFLLGVAPPEHAARWIEAVAGGDVDAPSPLLHSGWISWAGYRAGQCAPAFEHWLTIVRQVQESARRTGGEGLSGQEWHRAADPGRAVSTAMVLAPLVYGLLGIEPDATRHRARVAPQIPAGWPEFEATGIRVGDALLRLGYTRTGSVHRFVLEQQSGAIPLNIVFEPHLPAAHVASVRIDGRSATLDTRVHGDRLVTPVQIVLDHGRTIELETGSE